MSDSMLSVPETAEFLGVSEAWVRTTVRLKRLPFYKVGGKSIRFARTDLERFLESCRVAARDGGDRRGAEVA